MEPGQLFLLRNRTEVKEQDGPQNPWAVLSCPRCSTLGLITESQYRGQDSVLCGNPECSCHLFINNRAYFEFLPAH